jgi:hypothetical protein
MEDVDLWWVMTVPSLLQLTWVGGWMGWQLVACPHAPTSGRRVEVVLWRWRDAASPGAWRGHRGRAGRVNGRYSYRSAKPDEQSVSPRLHHPAASKSTFEACMRPGLSRARCLHAKVQAAFPSQPSYAFAQTPANHLSQLAALGRWGREGGAWAAPPQALHSRSAGVVA